MKYRILPVIFGFSAFCAAAGETNSFYSGDNAPDTGMAILRLIGALILVIGLLFAAVWFVKKWQQTAIFKGRPARLKVLEMRSLGHRHALYVVGYERKRFLVSGSPGGVSLLTGLPDAEVAASAEDTGGQTAFMDVLGQALGKKS
ncbi:MAG: flagellar biosynthetic protein FliO [Verrucomicrobia bacterium]|nr:flagellar biosynthetic protein FliO [Verrucomicrobiota bacterium]